ncbi:MAG: DUF4215 domain-containing protein [Armatimonadota bacterium]|nr:DUF4215 domain-containing protein [Armatimonadota bacterium]
MKNAMTKIGMLAVSAALVGACSGGSTKTPTTGSVGLAITIPDGREVRTIDLRIVCPDSFVDQVHTLDVVARNVVATFGGLAPGVCTLTMTSRTTDGYDCAGSSSVTVVAGVKVDATVDVVCQGTNASPSGNVSVDARFSQRACTEDRIRNVYAIPSDVRLGESTLVEVRLNSGNVVGTPTFTWATRNTATHTGEGTLAVAPACSADSASCRTFTCTGIGAAPTTDPRTGLLSGGVFVTVTVEDAECYDTEEVWVDCLQTSVCGDGTVSGIEECDDGNTASNDGCSATCRIERCGDGVLQTSEECDGILGVGPGQGCTADCRLFDFPRCGDGVVNQASEECDGTAGILPGQTCGPTCRIVPICGNGIVEAGEECDSTASSCVSCRVVTVDACGACIATIDEVGDYERDVCRPDAACNNLLACLRTNSTCWSQNVPASCFCGLTPAQIDSCETPGVTAVGPCAAEFRAAAPGVVNAEILNQYFDPAFPIGSATLIWDTAFQECRTACFP